MDGEIDFQGQKLVWKITYASLTIGSALAFLIGYFLKSMAIVAMLQIANYVLVLLVLMVD
jgi:uncharacterized membrane protein (Fun14 family)